MARRKNRNLQTLAFDRASVREIDENGFLHVAESPLTIVQVAPYYGYEIPHYKELGLDVRKTYFGYRPAEELSKPETIKSINGIPIQYGHHEEYPDRPRNRSRVGMTGTDGEFRPPYLVNSLHIIDRTAQDAIKSGEARELSLAYAYDPDFTGGMTEEGEKYDFIMRNITANHVALVEKGRAGPSVLVKDSSIKETPKMDGNEKLATIEEKLTEEVVPALQDALKEIQTVVVSTESETETPKAEEVPVTDATEAVETETVETETPIAPETKTETAVEEKVEGVEKEETPEASDAEKVEPEKIEEQATETEKIETPVSTVEEKVEGEIKDNSNAIGQIVEEKIPAPDPRMIQALLESGFSQKPEPLQRAFADGFTWAIKSIASKVEPPIIEDACNKSRDEAPAEIDVEVKPENESPKTETPSIPTDTEKVEERAETVTLASDQAQKIRESVIAEVKAIDECKPVLGNVRLGAFDSANGVYLEALKQLGIGNISGADARACYLSYVAGMRAVKQSQKQVIAQDRKPESAGLSDYLKNVKE